MANHRGNGEWTRVGSGILEGKNGPIPQGLAIINETIIVAKAFEYSWVDKDCRTESTAINMDVRDVAPTHARIRNLNCVCGYPIWKW